MNSSLVQEATELLQKGCSLTSTHAITGISHKVLRRIVKQHNIKNKQRRWSADDVEYLRSWYGRKSLRQLSEELQRPYDCLTAKARSLGLYANRKMAPEKEARIIKLYGTMIIAEIAKEVGVNPRTVTEVVKRNKVDRLYRKFSDEDDAFIRDMNARGAADSEIAALMDRDKSTVIDRRKLLGLPSNRSSDRVRQRRIAAASKKLSEDPYAFQYNRAERENYATQSGWPAGLSPVFVQILNILAASGVPLMSFEIASITGRTRGGTTRLCSKLVLMGWAVTLPVERACQSKRQPYRRGPGYTLSPQALSLLQEKAECDKEKEAP